jgi:hypothetical protein
MEAAPGLPSPPLQSSPVPPIRPSYSIHLQDLHLLKAKLSNLQIKIGTDFVQDLYDFKNFMSTLRDFNDYFEIFSFFYLFRNSVLNNFKFFGRRHKVIHGENTTEEILVWCHQNKTMSRPHSFFCLVRPFLGVEHYFNWSF